MPRCQYLAVEVAHVVRHHRRANVNFGGSDVAILRVIVHLVDQVLVPIYARGRKRPTHRADGARIELRWVDAGMVGEHNCASSRQGSLRSSAARTRRGLRA